MTFCVDRLGFGFRRPAGRWSRTAPSVHTVFNELSFQIPAGETCAVLGPSGIGKSTLLYLLGLLWAGKQGHVAGSICYTNSDGVRFGYADLLEHQRAALRRREFGFVLQSSYLLPHFTCAENIAMPLALNGRPYSDRQRTARELLQAADPTGNLVGCENSLASAVSGGQKQRVAVLRAIAHDPQVVFADEPFSALDAQNKCAVLQLLKRWQEGSLGQARQMPRTLILVCHEPDTARQYAARFLLLKEGFQCEVQGLETFQP